MPPALIVGSIVRSSQSWCRHCCRQHFAQTSVSVSWNLFNHNFLEKMTTLRLRRWEWLHFHPTEFGNYNRLTVEINVTFHSNRKEFQTTVAVATRVVSSVIRSWSLTGNGLPCKDQSHHLLHFKRDYTTSSLLFCTEGTSHVRIQVLISWRIESPDKYIKYLLVSYQKVLW